MIVDEVELELIFLRVQFSTHNDHSTFAAYSFITSPPPPSHEGCDNLTKQHIIIFSVRS
jgi:hypothetical protein